MTSLGLITAMLVAWNCGREVNNKGAATLHDEDTDSGHLAFDWSLHTEEDTLKLVTGWYYVVQPGTGVKRILDGDTSTYWLNPEPVVTAKQIATFELYKSNFDNSWGLGMKLDETGADTWRQATGRSVGGRLALVVRN